MTSGEMVTTSVNAVLVFIEAAEPRNEIEAALAIQMASTHAVTMAVLSRAGAAYGGDRHAATMASAGARLLNAFHMAGCRITGKRTTHVCYGSIRIVMGTSGFGRRTLT
jgi:hypothetical protein